MLLKHGRDMSKDLLYWVIDYQDPISYFPLLSKSLTNCWPADFDTYCFFYMPALLKQSNGAIVRSSDSSGLYF